MDPEGAQPEVHLPLELHPIVGAESFELGPSLTLNLGEPALESGAHRGELLVRKQYDPHLRRVVIDEAKDVECLLAKGTHTRWPPKVCVNHLQWGCGLGCGLGWKR